MSTSDRHKSDLAKQLISDSMKRNGPLPKWELAPGTKGCQVCREVKPLKKFPGKKNWSKIICTDCRTWAYRPLERGPRRTSRYTAYIKSAAWEAKKQEYWASGRHPRRCYVCGKDDGPLDMHHRTYARLGYESLDDLVPVCPKPCHARITREYKAERKKPRKDRRSLWEITEAARASSHP
jgi:hypothetical protein